MELISLAQCLGAQSLSHLPISFLMDNQLLLVASASQSTV